MEGSLQPKCTRLFGALAVLLLTASSALAVTIDRTIDFESRPDGRPIRLGEPVRDVYAPWGVRFFPQNQVGEPVFTRTGSDTRITSDAPEQLIPKSITAVFSPPINDAVLLTYTRSVELELPSDTPGKPGRTQTFTPLRVARGFNAQGQMLVEDRRFEGSVLLESTPHGPMPHPKIMTEIQVTTEIQGRISARDLAPISIGRLFFHQESFDPRIAVDPRPEIAFAATRSQTALVPEPSSLLLFLTGTVVLIIRLVISRSRRYLPPLN